MRRKRACTRLIYQITFSPTIFKNNENRQYLQYFQANSTIRLKNLSSSLA
jgi:hypothetical protein